MNKILIEGNFVNPELDESITFNVSRNELDNVIELELNIKKDTSLNLSLKDNTDKFKIFIKVLNDVSLELYEYMEGTTEKIQYVYDVSEYGNISIKRLHDISNIHELTIFNLNGYKANVNYELTTISKGSEKYDMAIYHNYKETTSNIINKGVNIKEGELVFNVSSFVDNNITDCILNQNSRIINMTNNKCQINPNLYIDENDVEASHSAHIGKFSDEEIFYMESRGIDYDTACNLLLKGFLINSNDNFIEKIDDLIEKYWR